MQYGFLIDNSSCIGCHACSTACKSENEVPLGVYRTWVKSTEAGVYPNARRSFQVTRCNHCANPPCVRICPTGAMYQRDDGIVQFDSDACIGCKGCMQACPYDAIHLDPESKTAAKCHFCSHRVDVGLEPACVVVCPEHAILAGDLDDPTSEISRKLSKHNATVRKPEQGTAPKLFYIEGNELTLHPTAVERAPDSFMWGDVKPLHGSHQHHEAPATASVQGAPAGGPIAFGQNQAAHMVQVAYNAQHDIQWHWPIPAYLVTKATAGGIFGWMSVTAMGFFGGFDATAMAFGGFLAILLTQVTLALLLYDLDRPDRFFYLLVRPQWRSWIARAAWILSGFAALSTAWWGLETAAWMGFVGTGLAEAARLPLAVLTLPFAVLTATYTAFLFAQAEGRDLWQTAHVPAQMSLHAVLLGSGALTALGAFADLSDDLLGYTALTTAVALVASLVLTLVADLGTPHASEIARRAQRDMTHGRYRSLYWGGGIALGHVVPIALLLGGLPVLATGAWLASALGLFAYNQAFVMAPQDIPNS